MHLQHIIRVTLDSTMNISAQQLLAKNLTRLNIFSIGKRCAAVADASLLYNRIYAQSKFTVIITKL